MGLLDTEPARRRTRPRGTPHAEDTNAEPPCRWWDLQGLERARPLLCWCPGRGRWLWDCTRACLQASVALVSATVHALLDDPHGGVVLKRSHVIDVTDRHAGVDDLHALALAGFRVRGIRNGDRRRPDMNQGRGGTARKE